MVVVIMVMPAMVVAMVTLMLHEIAMAVAWVLMVVVTVVSEARTFMKTAIILAIAVVAMVMVVWAVMVVVAMACVWCGGTHNRCTTHGDRGTPMSGPFSSLQTLL